MGGVIETATRLTTGNQDGQGYTTMALILLLPKRNGISSLYGVCELSRAGGRWWGWEWETLRDHASQCDDEPSL